MKWFIVIAFIFIASAFKIDFNKIDIQYAYVTNVFTKNDTTFIAADFVQMLTGKQAIKAAQQQGLADTTYNEDGTKITAIYVANDYFIVNQQPIVRTFAVAHNAIFTEKNQSNKRAVVSKKIFFKQFKNNLYLLTFKAGIITNVHKVYLP